MRQLRKACAIISIAVVLIGAAACSEREPEPETSTGDKVVKGPAAGVGSVEAADVSYASGVQVIDRPDAYVVWDTDPDGRGYTLDGDAPGVSKLAVGQVMLIKDEAVGRIRQLSREGDRTHVRVEPVGITDVFRNARLSWTDAAVDRDHMGILAWNNPNPVTQAAGDDNIPALTRQASKLFTDTRLAPLDRAPEALAASNGRVEYRFGNNRMMAECRVTADGVEVMLEYSRASAQGEIVTRLVNKISNLSSSGKLEVVDGVVRVAEFTSNVTGTVDLEVRATKQEAEPVSFKEIVDLPVEGYWPVYVGGVPFAVSMNWKMLVAPAIAAGKADIATKAHFELGGSAKTGRSDGKLQRDGSLTANTDAAIGNLTATTAGDSGLVVALRPRFGFGVGSGAGTTAYTDYIASVGVTSAAANAATPCKQMIVVLAPRAGVQPTLLGEAGEFAVPADEKTVTDFTPKVPQCQVR